MSRAATSRNAADSDSFSMFIAVPSAKPRRTRGVRGVAG
jgi:hypothetical protein